jgi:hypothetical protein
MPERETPAWRRAQPKKKHCATEAAPRCKNDSWERLLHKRLRPIRLEIGEANTGEARRSAKTPKEKPLRKMKRWN